MSWTLVAAIRPFGGSGRNCSAATTRATSTPTWTWSWLVDGWPFCGFTTVCCHRGRLDSVYACYILTTTTAYVLHYDYYRIVTLSVLSRTCACQLCKMNFPIFYLFVFYFSFAFLFLVWGLRLEVSITSLGLMELVRTSTSDTQRMPRLT